MGTTIEIPFFTNTSATFVASIPLALMWTRGLAINLSRHYMLQTGQIFLPNLKPEPLNLEHSINPHPPPPHLLLSSQNQIPWRQVSLASPLDIEANLKPPLHGNPDPGHSRYHWSNGAVTSGQKIQLPSAGPGEDVKSKPKVSTTSVEHDQQRGRSRNSKTPQPSSLVPRPLINPFRDNPTSGVDMQFLFAVTVVKKTPEAKHWLSYKIRKSNAGLTFRELLACVNLHDLESLRQRFNSQWRQVYNNDTVEVMSPHHPWGLTHMTNSIKGTPLLARLGRKDWDTVISVAIISLANDLFGGGPMPADHDNLSSHGGYIGETTQIQLKAAVTAWKNYLTVIKANKRAPKGCDIHQVALWVDTYSTLIDEAPQTYLPPIAHLVVNDPSWKNTFGQAASQTAAGEVLMGAIAWRASLQKLAHSITD